MWAIVRVVTGDPRCKDTKQLRNLQEERDFFLRNQGIEEALNHGGLKILILNAVGFEIRQNGSKHGAEITPPWPLL